MAPQTKPPTGGTSSGSLKREELEQLALKRESQRKVGGAALLFLLILVLVACVPASFLLGHLTVNRGGEKTVVEIVEVKMGDASAQVDIATGDVELDRVDLVSWPLVQEAYNLLEKKGKPGKWQSLADDSRLTLSATRKAVAWEVQMHASGRRPSLATIPWNGTAIWNTWPDASVDSATPGYRRFTDWLSPGTIQLKWSRDNPYLRDDVDYWQTGWGVKGKCLNSNTPRRFWQFAPTPGGKTPQEEERKAKASRNSSPKTTPHDEDNEYTQDDPKFDVKTSTPGSKPGNVERVERDRGLGSDHTGAEGTGSGGTTAIGSGGVTGSEEQAPTPSPAPPAPPPPLAEVPAGEMPAKGQ